MICLGIIITIVKYTKRSHRKITGKFSFLVKNWFMIDTTARRYDHETFGTRYIVITPEENPEVYFKFQRPGYAVSMEVYDTLKINDKEQFWEMGKW